jgi:hypothetical protein
LEFGASRESWPYRAEVLVRLAIVWFVLDIGEEREPNYLGVAL